MSIADRLTPDERKRILDARGAIRLWLSLDEADRPVFVDDPENDFYQAYGLIQRIKELVANLPGAPLPALPGSGEVRAADPFPGVVEALEHAPPRRDNGQADGGRGLQDA